MKLIDEKVIKDAAKYYSDSNSGGNIKQKLFNLGAEFAEQQLTPLFVEFAEWVYKGNHPYSHDSFCIGENRNKWHDDDGNFITTQQLLEEFIETKNKK